MAYLRQGMDEPDQFGEDIGAPHGISAAERSCNMNDDGVVLAIIVFPVFAIVAALYFTGRGVLWLGRFAYRSFSPKKLT